MVNNITERIKSNNKVIEINRKNNKINDYYPDRIYNHNMLQAFIDLLTYQPSFEEITHFYTLISRYNQFKNTKIKRENYVIISQRVN